MIELIDLYKSFNGQRVLDGLSLTIPTGQITVVIGKSGVGKSVLLKHIIGLLKPDGGRILVACYKGYHTEHGAEGVSKATNQTVVLSAVLVLAWDYILTSFFM